MPEQRIFILEDSVKKQIAAGEVVEGPFSVVKELMENALDAGSTSIDVEVLEGGLKKILVKDNGSGIYRDDLPLAIEEHATSKIGSSSDLQNILTYGFRGEALSSIASISRMSLFSRIRDEDTGMKLVHQDGASEIGEYAGPIGTTVIVENLFYNTPARKKFQKSRSAELKQIRQIFSKIALINYGIAFSFSSEGKRQLTLPPVTDMIDRIEQLYGEEYKVKLYFERLQDIKVEVEGFLSGPDFMKPSRTYQMLFVNGRPVEYRHLGFLISRAYGAMAEQGRHPAAFISINIDPSLTDVNIHPAKREIKFFDRRYIDELIYGICRKAIEKKTHTFDSTYLNSGERHAGFIIPRPAVDNNHGDDHQTGLNFNNSLQGINKKNELNAIIRDTAGLYREIERGETVNFIGIAFKSYVIVEREDVLYLIDFHAAHERFIYNDLLQEGMHFETQALTFPETLELNLEETETARDSLLYLEKFGFDIEFFSDYSLVIRGVPVIASGIDSRAMLKDLIETLNGEANNQEDIRNIAAKRVACHSAKRKGDKLTQHDVDRLIEKVFSGKVETTCPHGRPYIYSLSSGDLNRMFKRE